MTRGLKDILWNRQSQWLVGPVIGNIAVWCVAGIFLGSRPTLLGMALLAYGTGVRHALDADHLATIDSALRFDAERQEGSASAGLFFSLGHSTIVVASCVLLFLFGKELQGYIGAYMVPWSLVGSSVSIIFLLAVGVATLWEISSKKHQHSGLWVKRCHKIIRYCVARRWGLYVLGLLFALGFDTVTEIELLGMSALQLMQGVSAWRVVLLPMMFAAGMILIDTIDGLWAWRVYRQNWRDYGVQNKYRRYITIISSIMAILISLIQISKLFIDSHDHNKLLLSYIYKLYDINFGIIFSIIISILWIMFFLHTVFHRRKV